MVTICSLPSRLVQVGMGKMPLRMLDMSSTGFLGHGDRGVQAPSQEFIILLIPPPSPPVIISSPIKYIFRLSFVFLY